MKQGLLEKYTYDLTAAARENPDNYLTIARDKEIQQVIYNLSRKTKNNPILIGEAGVGKTAIVDGLARLIALEKAGPQLNGKHIRVLQIAALDQLSVIQKMVQIIEECKESKGENILFIDEIHTIMGVGKGALDLADVLKPAMARGEIQLIGSTTLDEYDEFIERDPALQRRFQQVMVNEPSKAAAVTMLKGIQKQYEIFHQVRYSNEAIEACVDLSIRYITDRYLPDKAIDLLDQAGAIAHNQGKTEVGIMEMALVLQEMRGIPVTNILKEDTQRLKILSKKLKENVLGQDDAIKEVSSVVAVAKAGLQDPNRPLASFLFLGTTGVGKTALSLSLADGLFDNVGALVRIDMSEFSERDASERFQNLITEQIKRQPYCVLLLDEIEKANSVVHDRLLQVLDAGELRDKRGRVSNFRNCIIIMTTNIAADVIADKETYEQTVNGLSEINQTPRQIIRRQDAFRKQIQMELTNIFRPEFVNRIDHKIVFNMLPRPIIKKIAEINLKKLDSRLARQGFHLKYTDDLIEYLADVGTDVKNGARPLQRVLERDVTTPVSIMLLAANNIENNRHHSIEVKVIDDRDELERNELQRHLINGRKIICSYTD